MNFFASPDALTYLLYRISGYALTNLGEDAALIAFMFC